MRGGTKRGVDTSVFTNLLTEGSELIVPNGTTFLDWKTVVNRFPGRSNQDSLKDAKASKVFPFQDSVEYLMRGHIFQRLLASKERKNFNTVPIHSRYWKFWDKIEKVLPEIAKLPFNPDTFPKNWERHITYFGRINLFVDMEEIEKSISVGTTNVAPIDQIQKLINMYKNFLEEGTPEMSEFRFTAYCRLLLEASPNMVTGKSSLFGGELSHPRVRA
jgi:hypothetical protein